jgi:hypothetical protein
MNRKWQSLAVLCLILTLQARLHAQTLSRTIPPHPTVVSQTVPPRLTAASQTSHGKLDILLTKASSPRATPTEVEQAVDAILKFTGVDPSMIGISSAKNGRLSLLGYPVRALAAEVVRRRRH